MKKIIFSTLAVLMLVSCGASKLVSTSTDLDMKGMKPVVVTDLMADLEVSPTKITFFYMQSKTVNNAGPLNVNETAIREALIANGNADVLVNLETQTKYTKKGEVESITVTGYPAKYVNFRSIDEKYILEMAKLYTDLNLKLYEPIPAGVPNIIPDIRPDVNPGFEPPKGPMQLIGKFG